jgi:hypothetical protein
MTANLKRISDDDQKAITLHAKKILSNLDAI